MSISQPDTCHPLPLLVAEQPSSDDVEMVSPSPDVVDTVSPSPDSPMEADPLPNPETAGKAESANSSHRSKQKGKRTPNPLPETKTKPATKKRKKNPPPPAPEPSHEPSREPSHEPELDKATDDIENLRYLSDVDVYIFLFPAECNLYLQRCPYRIALIGHIPGSTLVNHHYRGHTNSFTTKYQLLHDVELSSTQLEQIDAPQREKTKISVFSKADWTRQYPAIFADWCAGYNLYIEGLNCGETIPDMTRLCTVLTWEHQMDQYVDVQVQTLREFPEDESAEIDHTRCIHEATLNEMLDHLKKPDGVGYMLNALDLPAGHFPLHNPLLYKFAISLILC
ncbi:hypothetical protein K438DRAFT_2031904 [Mycena galopus ATCC 62051]|nr:hypothetical protein K438DRAFT_2031904 [Mycena galopus ATCC 62051]